MNTDHDPTDPVDELVAGLRADVPEMTDRAFAAGRTHLLLVVDPHPAPATVSGTAPSAPPRRRWLLRSPPKARRLIASAAAVVVLAAGVLVVQVTRFDENTPVASAAAAQLNSAAAKIAPTDEPLGPGQYRYIVARSWNMSSSSMVGAGGDTTDMGFTYLVEGLRELWVPADPAAECTLRSTTGENYKWLVGSAEKAHEMGIELLKPERMEMRIPCGDFEDGAWQQPSIDFLASLPRDPDALYERLRRDTEGRGSDPDLEVLVYVADVLRTGQVPADLRAALYRTLAKVPGLEITERLANLDGHTGTAYGITRSGERNDVIVDPATGQFIGERRIDLEGRDGVPPGTVVGYSSVTTPVIVDKLGATG
jgi:hypothetical protein